MDEGSNARRPLTVDDVLNLRVVDDAQVSPDGSQVVFVVGDQWKQGTPHPRSQLWTVDVGGGEARPFTDGPRTDRSPRWSPDGQRLVFVSDRGADRKSQLYLVDRAGGDPRQLTHGPGEAEAPQWAPDGRQVAYLTTDPLRSTAPTSWDWSPEGRRLGPALEGDLPDESYDDAIVVGASAPYRRVWSVDVEGGGARAVTPERLQVHEFDWSADGASLALVATRDHTPSGWYTAQLWTAPVDGGEARQVFAPALSQSIGLPTCSPDGDSIAFVMSTLSDQPILCGDVYLVAAAGGEPRNLTPGLRASVSWLAWPRSSAGPIYAARQGAGTSLGRVTPDGGAEELWSDFAVIGNTWVPRVSLASDGATFATTRADPYHPYDVWTGRLGEAWRQLTQLNPQAAQVQMGQMESITWKGADGLEIQGLLVYPVGYEPGRRYPLVVEVHGGPAWSWLPSYYASWHDWMQLLAGQGYAVLLPNPRGSTGFGTAYAGANVRDLFGQDYLDIQAGVDRAIEMGVADPERMGIGGWSYGGFMTSWTITQTDRFKAAINGAGLANWESYYGQNHIQDWQTVYFQSRPMDDPDAHRARSPHVRFRQVRTPTLVLQGEVDHDVPVAQAYEFWRVLTDLGVEVEFVLYPREAHPIMEKQHQRDLLNRVIGWFDRRLKGA